MACEKEESQCLVVMEPFSVVVAYGNLPNSVDSFAPIRLKGEEAIIHDEPQ